MPPNFRHGSCSRNNRTVSWSHQSLDVSRHSNTVSKKKKDTIDPASVMSDFFDYVKQYRIASSHIPETGDVFWPRLQTRGLLIELALKTFICAAGKVIKGHDLELLAKLAEQRGLVLNENDWVNHIRNTNKIYYKHRDWNADYISRYPTPDRNLAVWITPSHQTLDDMVQRIVEQAQQKWDAR